MESSEPVVVKCGDCGVASPDGVIDPPCTHCGSKHRVILKDHLGGGISPAGGVDLLRTDKANRILGYADSGRHGSTRHGNFEADDTISLLLEGKPPRNEEDTARVSDTLAAAMSRDGEHFTAVVTTEQDVDAELRGASRVLPVQMVKALSEMQFWRRLAVALRISRRLSLPEAVEMLAKAVEHKASTLPVAQRQRLVLALDADRLPALALEPVVAEFRASHGASLKNAGFLQVWLVGPDARLTWRLDG